MSDGGVIQNITYSGKHGFSVIFLASLTLGNSFMRDEQGYLLRVRGQWIRANLKDVIRAANIIRARNRDPQIAHNPSWVVPVPAEIINRPANQEIVNG